MAVLEELQPALELARHAPPMDFSDIASLRAQSDAQVGAFSELYVPEAPTVTTTEVQNLRVHRAAGAGPFPALVHFHGGGWILGSAQQTDRICRRLAERSGFVVASVNYGLAPEHPYPGPVEDCYDAVRWVVEHATELDVDPDRVAIGGQSAGGNLAAAVALVCRDRGGPQIVAQWLDVPALDLRLPDDDSLREFGRGFGLDVESVRPTIALYATDDQLTEPYASPLLAPSLEGLPPAIITVAGCDPLRDQGERYAAALMAAGVRVRVSRWDGHLHATMALTTLHPSAQKYEDEIVSGLHEFAELP